MFVIIFLMMFLIVIYYVFRYIDVIENIIVNKGFNKIVIDLNDIFVIEVNFWYENINGFYNILRI